MQPACPTSEGASAAGHRPTGLRGFWSLFVTQFQGAFSDNVLKNLVVFLIIGMSMSLSEKHRVGEMVGALFSLPFILFSMAGGYLADRFSKRTITIGVKIFEMFVMSLAMAGLIYQSMPLLLTTVFLMGTHSAFFGPSKYALLPELLPEKRLSWGNGLLELGTFMAIILGTVAAGFLSVRFRGQQGWSGLILILLAALGLCTSLGITRVPAANPGKKFQANFLGDLFGRLKSIKGDRPLVLAVIGNTFFNFVGALLLLNLFFYGSDVLKVDELDIGKLCAALALGIGCGSVAAGYLSGNKIEYGLVPLGSVGLAVGAICLAVPNVSFSGAMIRLALLGFAGGFFIVPIAALLQHRPDPDKKGEILAMANLLSFVGVFLASGAHFLLTKANLNPCHIFLAIGVLTVIGAVYALFLLPEALLRFALWVMTRTVYRLRVDGLDNIPGKGGALFVCNHLSFVDAMLLHASTDREVRFIMFKKIYELPWIRPFARIMRAIPISSEQRPREMIHAFQTASDAIRNGEVVCIFAEGQITRTGQMLPFRRGFERIMKDVEAPIIPVAIDGVWGSIFSFEKRRFLWKLPRRIPYPATVNFGRPLPHTATPGQVRQAVQDLMTDAWKHRKGRMRLLHRAFVRTARRHPFRFAMADAQTAGIKYGSALTRTVFLARRLHQFWRDEEMVGILLPPCIPGALANFAALLLGKTPVNLNYTVSEETLASCIQQCRIKTVLTSRTFLDKIKLKVPGTCLFIEEVAAQPGVGEKARALLGSWLVPVALLERVLGRKRAIGLDDLATVIFSSGSTGQPKGVMLSHYNIGSNIEQMEQVLGLDRTDRVLGVLPFFHSFGFTATLCLPAALGLGVAYYPNPLDAKAVGPMVSGHKLTFMLATPTFLQLYLRACAPEDFGGLRVVVTGAEKLPERLAAAFEERFGIRPFEAYGCTECSPAVTINTQDYRAAGFRQVGAKKGTIGHPIPGLSVRIVGIQTREPLPVGQPGMLLVRGPNVMLGYLGRPEQTAEVLQDGWYVTGDVAAQDEDGFLQITDRLSRFSKIGGEMVPHIKIEEKLHELAGVKDQTFVVSGLPDDKKGERLVVLHRLEAGALQKCFDSLAKSDLPNLWKPRPDQFFLVPAFPYLGTGKLDLRRVRELAAQLSVSSPATAESQAAGSKAQISGPAGACNLPPVHPS